MYQKKPKIRRKMRKQEIDTTTKFKITKFEIELGLPNLREKNPKEIMNAPLKLRKFRIEFEENNGRN